jgi:segregation and condensation protein A
MAITSTATPTLDAYQLRLPIFEGPLDVLLRLIERDQLAVSEVSLLAVLDQFLAFVHCLDSPSPDVIAEFAAVAGRLSALKSRALLPRPAKSVEEPFEVDLVRQLEEYRALKMAAGLLAERQRDGAGAFGRGEGIALPEAAPQRLHVQPPWTLTKAVSRWLIRLPQRPVPILPIRVVTLREMTTRIFLALEGDRQVVFESIRKGCQTRQDIAVAFLAVLTLLRRQTVVATQDDLFGAIIIARVRPIQEVERWPESIESEGRDGTEQLPA